MQGSVAGIQIAHAGRKASCAIPVEGGKQLDLNSGGWTAEAPSAIPFSPGNRIFNEIITWLFFIQPCKAPILHLPNL